ncbi:hypothetical protein BFJ63_vAg8617 [Fusarium oxysporum f. sp. narcissi]|uniref:Uncharacterized protein n=2 Tax=Fusarium oxysporum TaxID=5507 RepID=A0A4Q2VPW5_FUSOX|nr:hypothetical protein BFJ65_g6859 [Fusarium oxysporum f. sp. cepae]RKK50604.1 hypothetical protein BFJ66_g6456 [Fusarium oxysporum f. sp. cepae]RKK98792.1 hypothetical protein BFJ71_g6519 [Fusarium oxysporum]RKL50412.1 hypothetical protein BFJ70_g1572 [Fusarium oxysporum]RYC88555.1 hypothetical protein BFJ63_vAg8617 [Fusarium oxysporum f. sp. narcissi]
MGKVWRSQQGVPTQSSFIGQHRDLQVLIAWGIGKQFVESVGELQICSY